MNDTKFLTTMFLDLKFRKRQEYFRSMLNKTLLLLLLARPSIQYLNASCPSVCTYEYVPVCGSDGYTYPNLCGLKAFANCERTRNHSSHLKWIHDGMCESKGIEQMWNRMQRNDFVIIAFLCVLFTLVIVLFMCKNSKLQNNLTPQQESATKQGWTLTLF